MQTDMGGYQPWQAGTSGSLTAYEPTWRDKLARVLMGDQRASPERARLVEGLTGSRGMGSPGLGVVDAVPGVGQALQAQEAVRSGDTDMLAMALMPGTKQVKAATGAVDDAARTGIRAYHGSPHDFDRFDMSKIGTGEGAQAYGHGLYFAESPAVAETYKGAGPKQQWSQLDPPKVDGKMYEVRINADPNDFLDWDKPLSQQSEKVRGAVSGVRKTWDDFYNLALRSGFDEAGARRNADTRFSAQNASDPIGGAIMRELSGGLIPNKTKAQVGSERLRDAGIPGIKYLDQGSRTAGEGSRNYVVFRDDIIDIVKKYGIAAAASMYGMDQVQRVMLADQLQPAAQ